MNGGLKKDPKKFQQQNPYAPAQVQDLI